MSLATRNDPRRPGGRGTIGGMADPEPDIAELLAPLPPAQAGDVVLREAREGLPGVRRPVDAELWGSDMLGALSKSAGEVEGTEVMTQLVTSLVPAAEREATPEALALLRILAAIGSPALHAAAAAAADRLSAAGLADPVWAAVIGSPAVGRCWHYGDVGGQQESITVSFGYGAAEHALSVLVDHGQGGKIRDAWVDDAAGLLDKTWLAAQTDPLVVFDTLEPREAGTRLSQAIAAGEGP